MTYSQKYSLVHFIAPVNEGAVFYMSEWPLHATLADVFAIDRAATDITSKLATLIEQIDPIQTVARNDTVLGVTPVTLLKKTLLLARLHEKIISLLEENGATFNTPEFTRDGFLPHTSIQASGRLHKDDTVMIDSLSLIDMFPGGDWE